MTSPKQSTRFKGQRLVCAEVRALGLLGTDAVSHLVTGVQILGEEGMLYDFWDGDALRWVQHKDVVQQIAALWTEEVDFALQSR